MDDFFGSGQQVQEASAEATDERKRERAQQPTWFKPWREAEEAATALRYFDLGVIPGLLQTEEYARSVLEGTLRAPREVSEQASARLARQAAVLDREQGPVCTFILGTDALRSANADAAKAQLTRLLEVAERPQTFIHVVPESVGMYPGRAAVSFALATLDTAVTIGYLEDLFEGRVITDPARVTALDRAWHTISAVALACDQSREMIMKMVDDL